MRRRMLLGLLPATLALSACWREIEITGAGATFPAPIYARWMALFERAHPEVSMVYHAIGSGGGIRAITRREVDFGASDALLGAAETRALPAPVLTVPTVLGAVVAAYNLPDYRDELILSGPVLADIYLGRITRWNDPRIAELNAGPLPDLPVRIARRGDSSGTTNIFTDYLSHVSADWRAEVGTGKTVTWPTPGTLSGTGSDGLAHQVLLEPGGIGYLEVRYAENSGLNYATLLNAAGAPVRPTPAAVQSAEERTPDAAQGGLKPSIVDAPGAESYPLAAFTYLLVYRDLGHLPRDRAEMLVTFLVWCLTEGQQEAAKMHYVGLPAALRDRVLAEVEALRRTIGDGSAATH